MWIYGVIIIFIVGYWMFGPGNGVPVKSDWNTVAQMIEQGDVEKIQVVNRDLAEIYLKKDAADRYRKDAADPRFRNMPETGAQLTFNIGSVDTFRQDLDKVTAESGNKVVLVYENRENSWTSILLQMLPWIIIIGGWFFLMSRMSRGAGGGAGGIMNVGKARAQVFDKENSKKVTFKDVAGLEEAKVEIMEIVDFLKNPDKYKSIGAKIPKGALLVGPPGTGKTLGEGGGGRGQCAVLLDFRLGFRGDVRGRGRFARARPFRAGQTESSLYSFHRRNRRHRPGPR